jgi:hypothetical protein
MQYMYDTMNSDELEDGGSVKKHDCDVENEESSSCSHDLSSSIHYKKDREIVVCDAVEWMHCSDEPFEGSIFTGIPDMLDVHETCTKTRRKAVGCEQLATEYTAWFHKCSKQLFSRLASGECAVFSQTDSRVIDETHGTVVAWMDKCSMLCQAAETVPGVRLLWHKIAIDAAAATSSHRPCYTHVLCFGKHFTFKVSAFITPDVIDRGQMTWLKATGESCAPISVCRTGRPAG